MKATISGIPCIIQANEDGLEVLDRKGYPAEWLARKATSQEWAQIEAMWLEIMEDERAYRKFVDRV